MGFGGRDLRIWTMIGCRPRLRQWTDVVTGRRGGRWRRPSSLILHPRLQNRLWPQRFDRRFRRRFHRHLRLHRRLRPRHHRRQCYIRGCSVELSLGDRNEDLYIARAGQCGAEPCRRSSTASIGDHRRERASVELSSPTQDSEWSDIGRARERRPWEDVRICRPQMHLR